MERRILIGSIIAVAILVGVSFTGVVGFQSVKSDVNASPLFNMRISRAIDRDSKDIACNYVGKGEESILSFPKRNETKIKMEKVLDILTKMDDKTFNNFIQKINQDKRVKNRDIQIITKELFYLRDAYKEKPLPETVFICILQDLIKGLLRFLANLLFPFFWLAFMIYVAITGGPTLVRPTCIPDTYDCCPS